MKRQAELGDLQDQAVQHAMIAERMGFPATAEALWALASEVEIETQDSLGAGLWMLAPSRRPALRRAANDPRPPVKR
jgi:hypothetical protein